MERNRSAIEIGPTTSEIANAQSYANAAAASAASAAASAAAAAPVKVSPALLLHPYMGRGYGQFWAAGWKPHGFNQQWGGPWGGALPDGSGGDAWFEGYLPNSGSITGPALGNDATKGRYQEWVPSRSGEIAALYLCVLDKVGNPSQSITPKLRSDSAGPGVVITNGAGDLREAETVYIGWNKFTWSGTLPSITAGTPFYIGCGCDATDNSNYLRLGVDPNTRYPYGSTWYGDDASSWTENAGESISFIVEYADGVLESGGLFSDGKLSLIEDDPAAPYIPTKYLGNNISHEAGTLLWRGKVTSVSKPILDLMHR
jgi:hypothetical protein